MATLTSIVLIGGCATVSDAPEKVLPSPTDERQDSGVPRSGSATQSPEGSNVVGVRDLRAHTASALPLPETAKPRGDTIAGQESIANPSLWEVMRPSMALNHHTDNKRVGQQLRWLQKTPGILGTTGTTHAALPALYFAGGS